MRISKRIILICGIFLIAVNALFIRVEAQSSAEPATNESITVTSARIKWAYKTINGVKYKRGYDEKTNEWVTDWIKVG